MAKIWLEPKISVSYFHGFSNKEQKDILDIVFAHYEQFKTKWNEYFGK
jgi:hypothetical protein